jgi:hypothetical protein
MRLPIGLAWLNDRRQLLQKIERLESDSLERQWIRLKMIEQSILRISDSPIGRYDPLVSDEEWNLWRLQGRPWPSEQLDQ